MTLMETRTVEILLVDDNIGDVVLAKEALKGANFTNRVSNVSDGVEALDFLHRRGKYADATRPDFVLLDINMPRKNGHEVLAEIRRDKGLKSLPVIILTSSEAEDDISRAYELGANCFVTKPADLDEMVQVVQAIDYFWTAIAKLPRRH
jgi:chemotaxis family two-component system response regulator Rcp1